MLRTPKTALLAVTVLASSAPAQAPQAAAASATPGGAWADVDAALARAGSPAVCAVMLERDTPRAWREVVVAADGRLAVREWTESTARPARFIFADGTIARFSRSGADQYFESPADEFWAEKVPAVMLACPWAIAPSWTARARAAPDGSATRDGAGFLVRSPSERVALFLAPDGRVTEARSLSPDGGVAAAASFDYDAAGSPARIRVTIAGTDPEEWRVASFDRDPPNAERRLAFDAAAMSVNRYDPATGDITAPDGTVIGKDVIPAVQAMEVFYEKKRREETREMRENPHGVPMKRWLWWLGGLALVCVGVDQLRRRL
ncbi:MAG TPA: hypothetical protein VD971_10810 [Phycisphaerales bacterium]|nr:hypothetical protein [Phycisphaerales bacterium]